jgi:hypothetical protein
MSTRDTPGSAGKTVGPLRAGVARSDITTDSPDAVIRDRLYAKALVLDDGTTRVAIVTMDVTAISARRISDGMLPDVSEAFLPALRERVQNELGIPGANVLVNASHTHPLGRMLCDDDEQVKRTFDAVSRAARDLTEVRVGAGRGREDRITMNRTLRLKDGRHWTIRHANPCPPDDEVAGVGPVDPEIGILRVDRLDGRPLAVLYNFASHLLFADTRGAVTANFPGIASKLIEETLGHGAMAMFVQGAAGDVIDVTFKDFNRPRDVEPFGTMLGQGTLKAHREIPTTAAAGLRAISRTIELPRRTDIPKRIAALEQEQAELLESLRSTALHFESFLPLYLKHRLSPDRPADYAHRYLHARQIGSDQMTGMDGFVCGYVDKYLRNIRAMERLGRIRENIATLQKHQAFNDESGSATIPAEIQGIRVGDFVLLAAPLEVLTEVSLNVKRASPHAHTFVAGFSNGYLHYGPPAADYDKGGYEVNECLLAPEWQAAFEAAAREILLKL